jgi:N-acyl-L-homoserine lactone synthetase
MPIQTEFSILTVTPSNRQAHGPLVHDFFRLRKKVFVDELKWPLKVIDGDSEIDQFDRPSTVYHLLLDAEGRVRGGVRLLVADGTHMMSTVFQSQWEDQWFETPPVGPTVFESSRSCLDEELRGSKAGGPLYSMLLQAIAIYIKAHQATEFIFVVDRASFDRIQKTFPVRALAPGHVVHGEEILPAAISARPRVAATQEVAAAKNEPVAVSP